MNALPISTTRLDLRFALEEGGVPVGRPEDGGVATIVTFINAWGIAPGIPGTGADTPDIKRALDAAGIPWTMGNMIMVEANLIKMKVKFTGQRAYLWDAKRRGWVRMPLDIARLGVNEGRFEEVTS